MIVIFLHGPPASGKYTVGKVLSALLGVPLFHNHLAVDLARSLFEFGTPGFVKHQDNAYVQAPPDAFVSVWTAFTDVS